MDWKRIGLPVFIKKRQHFGQKSQKMQRMSSLRSKVFGCYRSLQRARLKTFAGDELALNAGRQRIKDEFIKNKYETDPKKIEELLKIGQDVVKMLHQAVVQGVYDTDKGRYILKVTEDTILQDNAPLPKKK